MEAAPPARAWPPATCSATPAWTRSGADLTRLAEATLECALEAVDPQVPMAIVAFGRLGGGELGYASDLDVAFVHDGADAAEAERVAAGVLRFVGGDTPAERIWAVDADLRPEGRSGPLLAALDGWEGYLDALGVDVGAPGVPAGARRGRRRRARATQLVARLRGRDASSSRSPATTSARCAA